jgi:hypothetical protein
MHDKNEMEERVSKQKDTDSDEDAYVENQRI